MTLDRRVAVLLLAFTLAGSLPSPGAADAPDPWEALSRLRMGLEEAGPQEMSFEQTFVPAGFSTGETESGTVVIDLPRCVRWDYLDPYPRSFLLCGTELHTWNAGESTGQLYALDRSQPGLDLLMLDRGLLEKTYTATLEEDGDDLVLRLEPRDDASRALASAEIRFTAAGDRVREIAYRDGEGNRTRFRFGESRPVAAGDRFQPPPGMGWQRETG